MERGFLRLLCVALLGIQIFVAGCTADEQTAQFAKSSSNSNPTTDTSKSTSSFKNEIPMQNRISSKTAINTTGLTALNTSGTVQVVAYLDPEDPFSARTYAALRKAAEQNTSYSIVIRFKTNPKISNSRLKARYIYAAAAQNKFWDMADLVFGSSLSLKTESDIVMKAQLLGIASQSLALEVVKSTMDEKIAADEASLQAMGSATAPSIYVNGVRVYDFEVSTADKVKQTISKVTGG